LQGEVVTRSIALANGLDVQDDKAPILDAIARLATRPMLELMVIRGLLVAAGAGAGALEERMERLKAGS
jgi:hypothetical protein